ncbi:MAG: peroxiredoxin family protein [Blastocatellia bacterium]
MKLGFLANVSRGLTGNILSAILLGVFLFGSGMALGLTTGLDDVPELPSADGSSYTPEILVTMIDKKQIKLSSLRGKVVMLDFFLTTCPHCQDHAPHVAELYNKYKSRGFLVLGLASDAQEKVADVRAFMKKYGLTYPVGFNTLEASAYFTDSHNRGVPQMVVFGTDGKMKIRRIGWDEKTGKDIEEAIATALGKTAGAAPATAPAKLAPKAAAKPRRA